MLIITNLVTLSLRRISTSKRSFRYYSSIMQSHLCNKNGFTYLSSMHSHLLKKWVVKLFRYDHQKLYKLGRENLVADALSHVTSSPTLNALFVS